jgi:hypothetical protein
MFRRRVFNRSEFRSITDNSTIYWNPARPKLLGLECVSAAELVAQAPTSRWHKAEPTVVVRVTKYDDERMAELPAHRQALPDELRGNATPPERGQHGYGAQTHAVSGARPQSPD